MKVLVVNDAYSRSSAAGAAVRMAEAVAARGVEVHFLASVQQADAARVFEGEGLDVRLVHVPPYPIRWRAYRSLNNKPAVRALAEVLRELAPDIVHFHNLHIHFSYASMKAAARSGASVALTVHDVMPFCNQKMFCFLDESLTPETTVDYRARFGRCLRCVRFRFNPLRNRIIRNVLRRYAHRILPVSRPMADALEQNRIPVHQVIPNGIDLEAWRPMPEKGAAFRERFGLENDKLIFHGGRLDALKGGLHLVRALATVQMELPEAKLVVAGEGDAFQEEMLALAAELGNQEALVFPGWLSGDDLKAAYAAADVIASPSLCFESFNLMNLEGMAMGKPVVSSFFGGPAEVVEDGVTGILVNPLDINRLSKALIRILREDDLAARMGAAARIRAEAHYDLKKSGDSLHTLYRNLVKGM